jgi:hypothetical protein
MEKHDKKIKPAWIYIEDGNGHLWLRRPGRQPLYRAEGPIGKGLTAKPWNCEGDAVHIEAHEMRVGLDEAVLSPHSVYRDAEAKLADYGFRHVEARAGYHGRRSTPLKSSRDSR